MSTRTIPSLIAVTSLLLQQFLFIGSVYASELPITPDGTTNTQVTQTASGIDQINIAAPNSSGLSHNKFIDYNVNQSGQILNNFSGNESDVISTQIGGLVLANPNLRSSGSATVILNEVTSANISELRGYVEVAGTKADVIIANPNGIFCSGCGFINISRLSIVAGKTGDKTDYEASGDLIFNLSQSKLDPDSLKLIPLITISGLGLDASRTSATDIISSSVKLISSIYGSNSTDISIKTGDNSFNYNNKEITSNSSSPILSDPNQPLFAIDASSLAKIQSGRIYLIATKAGLGVNMAAEVLANDSIQIDANGDIHYTKLAAGNSIDLKSTQNIQSIARTCLMGRSIFLKCYETKEQICILSVTWTSQSMNSEK